MFLLCPTERLLILVRKLIDYGKELAATVSERVATDPAFARRAFGIDDLALIVATITRGLNLAFALEARLVERAKYPEPKPRPARAPSPPKPRPPRPAACAQAPDPRFADLPTPEQLAAEIRRRPIGAVIADICRDLGITPGHPLWHEVQEAICRYNGNFVRFFADMIYRDCPLPTPAELRAMLAAPLAPPVPSQAGTGPP